MAGRWALFKRFLSDRLKVRRSPRPADGPDLTETVFLQEEVDSEPESPTADDTETKKEEEAQRQVVPTNKSTPIPAEVALIDASGCKSIFGQLSTTYYIPLETWYLRSVIDKV